MRYLLLANTSYEHLAKNIERVVLMCVGRDGSEMAVCLRTFLLVSAFDRARMAFTSSLARSVMSTLVRGAATRTKTALANGHPPVFLGISFQGHKAHFSRNFIPNCIFIVLETFSSHFLNGPLQQIKKQFTVTLKFRNERLSKYYLQNTNVTL